MTRHNRFMIGGALVVALAAAMVAYLSGVIPGTSFANRRNDDPGGQTMELVLYFGDTEAMLTGTPGEFGLVTPVARTVAHSPDVLAAALEELVRGPLPDDGDLERTVPATLEVLAIRIEDGVAVIDVSSTVITAPDGPAGTLGGAVFVQSLMWTATEVPGVDKVMLTVEGEPFDDGHFVWDEPLGRNASP